MNAEEKASSNDTSEAREQRRRARHEWPIRRFRLGDEPSEDLRSSTTPSERLAMVWELSVRAWRLAGREIPDYERHNMPGRLVRSSDPR